MCSCFLQLILVHSHQYYLKYLGRDPFGRTSAGVDIKSYAMAKYNIECRETTKKRLKDRVSWEGSHTHNALDDAIEQANLFEEIRKWLRQYI